MSRERMRYSDLGPEWRLAALEALFDFLGLEVEVESTPDYTTVDVVKKEEG